MRRIVLTAATLTACGKAAPPPPGPTTPVIAAVAAAAPEPTHWSCTPLPFAESTPVPEASGAAWLTIDGALSLVVTSDSGNAGAYGIVDPETGATHETGSWPLGDGGDDLEGLATRDGKIYGLSSSGWMRVWERSAGGFTLVDGPYPIGPVDLPDHASKFGNEPPDGTGMVCGRRKSNCGRNYEGLCLAAHPPDPSCVGFALAKADGHLYCLAVDGPRLRVRHEAAIEVGAPGAIADCAFDEADHLYVGANLFDLSRVYRVAGWQDVKTAHRVELGVLSVGFPEVVAARGVVASGSGPGGIDIYRMSDTGGSPSKMAKFRCTADER